MYRNCLKGYTYQNSTVTTPGIIGERVGWVLNKQENTVKRGTGLESPSPRLPTEKRMTNSN